MSRTRTLAVAGVVAAVAAVVALALFQPWKLWVDERVVVAAPVGAAPLAVAPTGPPTTAAPATAPTTPPTTAPAVVGSMFVSLDHGTTGTVVLLEDAQGRRYVRFEGLDTSNGPDLKVYLSANGPDGPEDAFDDVFVDLGRLQGNVGDQNYEVPAEVDLSVFRSVVIWCDRFDSAFGAAPLP